MQQGSVTRMVSLFVSSKHKSVAYLYSPSNAFLAVATLCLHLQLCAIAPIQHLRWRGYDMFIIELSTGDTRSFSMGGKKLHGRYHWG